MSVTAAEGFVAAGCHAGVKRKRLDFALLATSDGQAVPTAAVFTQNKFRTPPVEASLERLTASGGMAAGVIVNSGNANAGTGKPGRADSEAMCDAAAKGVGCTSGEMLVCSTGLIGIPLPIDRILAATPKLARKLTRAGHGEAAKGILTTDTRPKEAVVKGGPLGIGGFTVGGWPRAAACWRRTWRRCWPS